MADERGERREVRKGESRELKRGDGRVEQM